MNDNNIIKLENEWFITKDKEESLIQKYSIHELMVYAIIRLNLNLHHIVMIKISDIYSLLKISKNNHRSKGYIRNAFQKLNNNLYTIYEDYDCSIPVNSEQLNSRITYYIKLKNELKGNFFIIYTKELFKIIEISKNNKLEFGSLFAHFSYIVKSFSNTASDDNYKTCFPSIETIAKNTNLSSKTILNHNKIFIENNLLLIGNAGKKNDKENIVNVYARPNNQEQFDKALKAQQKGLKHSYDHRNKKEQEDRQRSLKQDIIKFKRANNINENNIDTIKEKLWIQLNEVERIWYNYLTITRQKECKRGSNLLTIKTQGENKGENKKQFLGIDNIKSNHWGIKPPASYCKNLQNAINQ